MLSYFELMSPVLDAFEVDAQVTIILFSLAASLALLNEMMQSLVYTLTPSSSAKQSSTNQSSGAMLSALKLLTVPMKVASSRYPLFKRLLSMTSLFK